MSVYQVAPGWNNAGELAAIVPQGASPDAIQYPELRYAADGSASFHGYMFMDLVWSSLERAQYNSLMTQFGLSQTTASARVTVTIREDDDSFANYNATAIHVKAAKRARPFWKQLTIRLRNLEALS